MNFHTLLTIFGLTHLTNCPPLIFFIPVFCCFSSSGLLTIKSAPKIQEKSDKKISASEPSGIAWVGPEGHHQGPRRPGGVPQKLVAPGGRLAPSWTPWLPP